MFEAAAEAWARARLFTAPPCCAKETTGSSEAFPRGSVAWNNRVLC